MKPVWIFCYFVAFLLVNSKQLYAQNKEAVRARCLELLKKYDPDGYYVLTTYAGLKNKYAIGSNFTISTGPATDFMVYVDGKTDAEILKDLGTAVHEMFHGYSHKAPYAVMEQSPTVYVPTKSYDLIWIDAKTQYMVPITTTFSSRDIASTIAEDLRTFRFKTYILSSSNIQSTQQHGVYGLLNEMAAYYHDTKTAVNLYDYFAEAYQNGDASVSWMDYFQLVSGVYYAHAEFRFYILSYLLYARQKYPLVYDEILSNKPFVEAFLAVDQKFTDLMRTYEGKKEAIFSMLKDAGEEIEEDSGFISLNGFGIGTFRADYDKLWEAMQQESYLEMMKILQDKSSK